MMALFGIAILAMIWFGFRRWLQYKEILGRLSAEQTAERAVQRGAQMEQVEERLNAIEQIVAGRRTEAVASVGALPSDLLAERALKRDGL
jgi:cell division protein FtsB